jgi:hypothetical protein
MWMKNRIRALHVLTLILVLTLSLVWELQVAYAAAPSVTTLSPTNVTATSATLRGSVNPNGKSTSFDFASGLPSSDPGYFSPVPSPPQNIGSGTVALIVSYTLTGLHPGTEYRYAVRAGNADGNHNGAVVTFHTLPAAATTDWAVVSVNIQPPSPNVGDYVQFAAAVQALSTSGGYPQSFYAQCTIDGISCGAGTLSYPGPTGAAVTVSSPTPWYATPGTHTLSWQVSTANDPNPGNNFGSLTFPVGTPAAFDFDLTISPSTLTLQPGQSQTVSVSINPKSGTPQPVTLTVSGQPSGVNPSLNPAGGTPPYSSTLSISVSSSAVSGTYSLTVTGSGGGQTHSSVLTLTISQAADFHLEVNPTSQSASQGQTVSYSVNVVGSNGFNSPVSLSVSGLPSGASGVFSVASGTIDFSSTLTITLPSNVPTGSFTVVIAGSGGGLDRSVNAVLTITAATVQTQVTTQSGTSPSGIMDMLQQNSLLVIAVLVILVIALAAVAMSRRGRPSGSSQKGAGRVFCGKCGTENPSSNEFCSSCGSRLKST